MMRTVAHNILVKSLEAIGGEVCDLRKGINTNVSNRISGVHWSPLEAIGGGDQKYILLLAIY